eukprot:TRINITY_DN18822_c0_g1_i1.p1 TRINITY_DN18822_c0_g1~~TRINITY_DN18822_c0_g1_i1.p1  ORF type:complete len:1348 (+),score=259.46 TRINITY_DN18822_c0_g1_i1:127-4044(+)
MEGLSDDNVDDLSEDSDSEGEDSESEESGVLGAGTAAAHGRDGGRKSFVTKLRDDLKTAPFDAEFHAALIDALRKAADLDGLREARRCAAERVPLPEAVWLEWIEDERSLATDDDFAELDDLHSRSCAAHPLSARLWLARCALYREVPQGRGQDAVVVRRIFEDMLDILGLHPTVGPELWANYREFEASLLATVAGDDRLQQANRVRTVFFRQLALPLPEVGRLVEELAAFESGLQPVTARDASSAEKASALAEAAAELWQERAALEQRFIEASRPMVTIGVAGSGEETACPVRLSAELLALEEASGDSGRILLAHLRATHAAPTQLERWVRFADFAWSVLGNCRVAAEVLDRAVRYLPGESELWLRLHTERESAGAPLPELRKVIDRAAEALQHDTVVPANCRVERSPLQPKTAELHELFMQHADACRRAAAALPVGADASKCWTDMRSVLSLALDLVEGDESLASLRMQVLLRWMRLEAYGVGDVRAAVSVGTRLVNVWGSYYNVWGQVISAVRCCAGSGPSGYSTVRGLYKKAVDQVSDYPDQAHADYLDFERECGTLQSYRTARDEALQRQADVAAAPTAAAAATAVVEEHAQEETLENKVGPSRAARKRPPAKGSGQASKRQRKMQPEKAMAVQATVSAEKVVSKSSPSSVSAVSPAAFVVPTSADSASCVSPLLVASSAGSASTATVTAAAPDVLPENSTSSALAKSEPAVVVCVPDLPAEAPAIAGPSVTVPSVAVPMDVDTHGTDAIAKESMSSSVENSGVSGDDAEKGPATKPSCTDTDIGSVNGGGAAREAESPACDVSAGHLSQEGPDSNSAAQTIEPAAASAATAGSKVDASAVETAKITVHRGSHYHQKKLAQKATTLRAEDEGQNTVYVSNLDWSVSEQVLYRIFSDVDGLKEVRLVRDFLRRSKGFAYIEFYKSEQVALAVETFNGHEINKRPMKVARSLPTQPLFEERKLFVAAVAAAAREEDVRVAFAIYGEVVDVRMPLEDASSTVGRAHKGYAYVEFSNHEAVEAAVAASEAGDHVEICGHNVRVSHCIPMKDHRHQKAPTRKDIPARVNQKQIIVGREEREDPVKLAAQFSTTIHIKHLAAKVNDDRLREHFASCGEVVKVLVVRGGNGKSKGFGFVEFSKPCEAQAGTSLNDSELCGRAIVVSRSSRGITEKKKHTATEVIGVGTAARKDDTDEVDEKDEDAPKTKGNGKGKGKSKGDGTGTAKRKLEVAEDAETGVQKVSFRAVNARSTPAAKLCNSDTQSAQPSGRAPQDSEDTKATTAAAVEAASPAKPLSNADFRKFLLG